MAQSCNSYPALELSEHIEKLKEVISELSPRFIEKIEKEELRINIRNNIDELNESISYCQAAIKPITLLIDRAGGGKTNLLCDLALEMSVQYPVFFMSAKSVAEPTDDSIMDYFKSSYPISDSPIDDALKIAFQSNYPVVIIIDGINEHYNPVLFNAAFKNFVKRLYGRQVRYIVSCRDIYWRFFEDDWWGEHCEEIARDELYQFSANEFRKALPKYLESFNINVAIKRNAKKHLTHPLLLRFFCEAYKGSKDKKSELGTVNDVHLLPLFDTYCENKYEQIRKRLNLLSPSEISELVEMLGLMMLENHNRLVPISEIRERIGREFGEINIHSPGSKYVQILDEDIIIEQVPSGSLHKLNVEFVYDEFMEYVIARSLYGSLYTDDIPPMLQSIFTSVNELLAQEKQFVSVSGVAIFIGGIVAERSKNDGLEYVNYLLEIQRADLACRILGRWPEKNIDEKVAKILISLHSKENNSDIRKSVWQTLEDIHWHYWGTIYSYITHMPMVGFYKRSRVFAFLKRSNGGVTKMDKWESLRWIGTYISTAGDKEGADYNGGVSAFQHISKKGQVSWSNEETQYINSVLEKL